MLFIVEIILTVVAWRKGWRQRALLPMAIGVAAGFLIGAIVGLSGGSVESIGPGWWLVFLLGDLAVTGALIGMINQAPRAIQPAEELKAAVPTEIKADSEAVLVSSPTDAG